MYILLLPSINHMTSLATEPFQKVYGSITLSSSELTCIPTLGKYLLIFTGHIPQPPSFDRLHLTIRTSIDAPPLPFSSPMVTVFYANNELDMPTYGQARASKPGSYLECS